MIEGQLVKAIWYDGLILVGRYSRESRGYVILIDEEGKDIVCHPTYVRLEVVDET